MPPTAQPSRVPGIVSRRSFVPDARSWISSSAASRCLRMIGSINDHFYSSRSFVVVDGTYAFKSPRSTSSCAAARRLMDVFGGFTTSGSIQRLADQADDERPKAEKGARLEQPRRLPRVVLVDRGHRR